MSVRLTTRTCSIDAAPSTASSTESLSGAALPRRHWPSVVTTSLASASSMRERSAEDEKPAKTTLWVSPRRAHASIETMASGTMGM